MFQVVLGLVSNRSCKVFLFFFDELRQIQHIIISLLQVHSLTCYKSSNCLNLYTCSIEYYTIWFIRNRLIFQQNEEN